MNNTDNIYEKFAQAGGGRQMSQNVEQNFVNTAVSYTHLDVYKRQVHMLTGNRREQSKQEKRLQ